MLADAGVAPAAPCPGAPARAPRPRARRRLISAQTGPQKTADIDSVTPLTIEVADAGAARRITAVGELDLTTSSRLQETAIAELEAGHDVELDVSGVPFADSSALRCLLVLGERARALDASFLLLEPLPAQLRRVLDVTGLLARLPLAPRVADPDA